ncbi:MAG: GGDEF domain-containing protein [Terracidiphilus sp.]|jgi:diguanylate cyclase (GGDEF)-like protein
MLISIKKFLDMERPRSRSAAIDGADDLLSIVENYRATIRLFGSNASLDGSEHSVELDRKLGEVDHSLAAEPTAACVKKCEPRIQFDIQAWGRRVAEDSKKKAEEVKEFLLSLAQTAEAIGNRDKNHTIQFSRLSEDLKKIGDLNDLSQIRAKLREHVFDLKLSVEQMAQESRNLVAELKNEVSSYELKLKCAEDLACTDELTGVANRRGIESFIASNIAGGSIFTIVVFDLNKFKAINDSFGHVAGDEILKQFARRLRSNTRERDRVGRWGGDEFIVVMTCGESQVRSMLGRVKDHDFERYMLRNDNSNFFSPIYVGASTGVAEWQSGETIQQLIARADAEMYKNKAEAVTR